MGIEFIQGTDDKLKANVYTLKKTENAKSAVIKVIDYDNEGFDNHDGVVVSGDTSIFTADEIKGKLLNGYRNTTIETTTKNGKEVKLPEIASSEKDGKIKFEENKECNLGSFAKRMAVEPPKTAQTDKSSTNTINPSVTNSTMPSYPMTSFGSLSTGMPMLDTSLFENTGMGTQAGMPSFDFGKYQQQSNMANGIGSLLGMLSAYSGENDFASSFMLPLMMSSMMGNIGNFFTSPASTPSAPTTNTAPASTENTTTENTPAPTSSTATVPAATISTASTEPIEETDVVTATKKEQEELQNEKVVTTSTNGRYKETFIDKNGDKIEDVRDANGYMIGRNIYYKGTNDRRTEYFQGENKGKITKSYTDEQGNRVVETYKRVADNKSVLQKKYINGEVVKSTVPVTTEARGAKVDAKIKTLHSELAVAEKEFKNTTGNGRIGADKKIQEIKEKIENQNNIKNSPELKKLDAELVIAKAKHAKAKTGQERQAALKEMVRLENQINQNEANMENPIKNYYNVGYGMYGGT